MFRVCARLEEELAQLMENPGEQGAVQGGAVPAAASSSMEELAELLAMAGLERSSLDVVAANARALLRVGQFYTTGEIETRAWPISLGATAREAAGVIHSDLAKNFVRAEVCSAEKMLEAGTVKFSDLKQSGLVEVVGPGYVMQPKDVMIVRAS